MASKRRRKRRAAVYGRFANVIYRTRYQNINGGYKKTKREFPSHDAAVAHLSNIKLGLEEEIFPWSVRVPIKIVYGIRRNGNKIVQGIKHLNGETDERSSVRREKFSGGLPRKHSRPSFSVPKNLVASGYWSQQAMYDIWSSGTSTSSGGTPSVGGTGNGTWQIPDTSWDRLPFSALV